MREKKFWNAEKLMSITAVLISIGTLFTILYQTNLMRKQAYASALPYLEVWNAGANDSYELLLVNNGIGPAFIDDVRVIWNDEIVQDDPYGFYLKHVINKDPINGLLHSNVGKGRVIPAGQRVKMLDTKGSAENAQKLRGWFGGDKAIVEIEYSSVYEEKWVTGMGMKPKKIE